MVTMFTVKDALRCVCGKKGCSYYICRLSRYFLYRGAGQAQWLAAARLILLKPLDKSKSLK